jgi:hypothetical protein
MRDGDLASVGAGEVAGITDGARVLDRRGTFKSPLPSRERPARHATGEGEPLAPMQNAKPPHPNPLPRGERGKHTLIQHDPGARAQRRRHAAQAPALRAGTQTCIIAKIRAALAPTRVAAALFNPPPVDWVPASAGMTTVGMRRKKLRTPVGRASIRNSGVRRSADAPVRVAGGWTP